MKTACVALALIALTTPALANGLSVATTPFTIATSSGTGASGSLRVASPVRASALLTIAAATNSSNGTK
ncbi:MAG: hypothetical protein AB8B71_06235 [Paracoccaceae bacterium]